MELYSSDSHELTTRDPFGTIRDNAEQCGTTLANFQPTLQPNVVPPTGNVNIIFCRFSSELQRTENIQDQARRCRDGLGRKGIPYGNFIFLSDEAMSGTCETRPMFQQLKKMVYAKRLGIVVVTEQSRLSRGDNTISLIKDIIFHGGRFISITENIDTL